MNPRLIATFCWSVWMLSTLQIMDTAAATIDVGIHRLLPETKEQVIQFNVVGTAADQIQGLNFNVQIADGGPEAGGTIDGPEITRVDIVGGILGLSTIFTDNNVGQSGGPVVSQVAEATTTTKSGMITADGVLGFIEIDTTGFAVGSGPWDLILSNTLNAPTDFAGVPAIIRDGGIVINVSRSFCDFNDDTICDLLDIDLLYQQANLQIGVSVSPGNKFDLDGNDEINDADLTEWLSFAATENGYDSSYLRGDIDLDHDVDMVDLTEMIIRFTGVGHVWHGHETWGNWRWGDTDGDGDVDTSDLTTAIINYTGAMNTAVTVPEPSCLFLLMLAISCLSFAKARDRRVCLSHPAKFGSKIEKLKILKTHL